VPLSDDQTATSLRAMYHSRIRAICTFYTGHCLELPAGMKHMKPQPPEKFDGEDEVDDFMDWVIQVCRHFMMTGLSGRENDALRKLCTASFLGKRPRQWYDNKISKMGIHGNINLPFPDAIICIFDRYIRAVTSESAYEKYNAVTYKTEEGVQGLFDELLDTAEKLVQPPAESELTRRFLDRLPRAIAKHLYRYDKVRADRTKLVAALDFALEYEVSQHELQGRALAGLDQGHTKDKAKEDTAKAGPTPRDQTKNCRDRGRVDSRLKETSGHGDTQTPAIRHARGSNAATDGSRKDRRYGDDDIPVDPRYKDIECYKCHQKGHLAEAHDRLRTSHKPSRMSAMRLVDDRSEGDQTPTEEPSPAAVAVEPMVVEEASTSPSDLSAYEAYAQAVYYSESSGSEATVHMRAIKSTPAEDSTKPLAFRSSMTRAEKRPTYPPSMRECLAAYICINGLDAWTLFDLGSDCDAISPSFAQIARVKYFELARPVSLELGCKGSKSKITHGAKICAAIGNASAEWYFDIANIVHYDAIVGMPFCSKYGLTIDVPNRTIQLADGTLINTSLEGGRTGGGDKFTKPKPKPQTHSFRA
jgi:hypothetical protein